MTITAIDTVSQVRVPREGSPRGESTTAVSAARFPGLGFEETPTGIVLTRNGYSSKVPWVNVLQVHYAPEAAPAEVIPDFPKVVRAK